jgi:hypothetical protein
VAGFRRQPSAVDQDRDDALARGDGARDLHRTTPGSSRRRCPPVADRHPPVPITTETCARSMCVAGSRASPGPPDRLSRNRSGPEPAFEVLDQGLALRFSAVPIASHVRHALVKCPASVPHGCPGRCVRGRRVEGRGGLARGRRPQWSKFDAPRRPDRSRSVHSFGSVLSFGTDITSSPGEVRPITSVSLRA